MSERKKGGGGRKINRNKEKCERYEKAMTREKNKARRAAKRAKKDAYFARRKAEREALNE